MTVALQDRISDTFAEEMNCVGNIWGWLLAVGIVQIFAGALAITFAFTATMVSVVTLGILLLIAAVGQTAAAILARDWGGFLLFLLLGVIYGVAGFLTIQHTLLAAEALTLMLASVYIVAGIFRIFSGFVEGVPSRGWVLLNGVISLVLGILIWQEWPVSGLWVLGMFIGIDLVVNGATWSELALCVRNKVNRRNCPG